MRPKEFMKEIMTEYGRTVLAAIAFLLIMAVAFSIPILGKSGLLAATGSKTQVTGSAGTGLSSADAIKDVNSVTYEITQNTTEIKTGQKVPLGNLLTSTDNTAVFSLTAVVDENKNDMLESGDVVYDRSSHSVTFNKRGFYSIQVRASGKQLQRYAFVIYAQ
ncbi:MAG: hypothetical protein ACI4FX_02965 [Agathobacter sp.]